MVLTDEVKAKLGALINQSRLMLFMKGTPEAPMCGECFWVAGAVPFLLIIEPPPVSGFSSQMVSMLRGVKAKFGTFDVLGDEEVRQGLKELSDWPTYPQLYLDGELLGGLDVVRTEMSDMAFTDKLPKKGEGVI